MTAYCIVSSIGDVQNISIHDICEMALMRNKKKASKLRPSVPKACNCHVSKDIMYYMNDHLDIF